MALIARDEQHQQQINAGISGRKRGHKFEETLTNCINSLKITRIGPATTSTINKHIFQGNPAIQLLQYIADREKFHHHSCKSLLAWWFGYFR